MTRETLEVQLAICRRFQKWEIERQLDTPGISFRSYGDHQTRMADLARVDAELDMDWTGLLEADQFDFIHDVAGIHRHMDRSTGKLGDCFSPRFTL